MLLEAAIDNYRTVISLVSLKTTDGILDEIKFLAESKRRIQILSEISNGTNTKTVLREKTDIPKTSLNRCLKELRIRSLVAEERGYYNLTGFGKLMTDEFYHFTKKVSFLNELKGFLAVHNLANIPTEFIMGINQFENFELLNGTELLPYKNIQTYTEHVREAEIIRALLPLLPIDFEVFLEKIQDDTKVGLVVTNEVLEIIKSDLDVFGENGDFQLFVAPLKPPLCLTIFEDFIWLGFFNRNGEYDLKNNLIGKGKNALRWGERLFEYYKRRSKLIPVETLTIP